MARILVVDDDPAQRALLKETLESAGHSVTSAPDAIQGLVVITRESPELILSDILMPRMDGFTFIREAKSRPELRAIPFLFVTSSLVSDEDRQFAQMLGAEAILSRFDDATAVLNIIQACLKRHTRAARSPSISAPASPPIPIPGKTHDLNITSPANPEDETPPFPSYPQSEPGPSTDVIPAGAAAPVPEESGEERARRLQDRITELEGANRALEHRARELNAIATERDHLLETIRARALELEMRVAERSQYLACLTDLSNKITATAAAPELIFQELVQQTAALLRAAECSLFLYDSEKGVFRGAASSSFKRDTIRQVHFKAGSSSAVQRVVEQRVAAAVCNIDRGSAATWTMVPRRVIPLEWTGDLALIVPLSVPGYVHGMLVCTDHSTGRIFTLEEMAVVTELAGQAALALENARLVSESTHRLEELYRSEQFHRAALARIQTERDQLIQNENEQARALEQQIQDRRRQLDALGLVSRAINETFAPETVLDQIVQSARSLVQIDACNLFLFNPDNSRFQGAASSTLARESIRELYFSANNSLPLYGLVQGQAALTLGESDPDRSLRNFPLLEQAFNAKAALITPIVAHGTVLGLLLSIDSNARRVFTPEEIELLTIFADQAATVLEQARLFHEAEGARQQVAAAREQLAQIEDLAAAAKLTGADALELGEPLVMILKRVDRLRTENPSSILEDDLQRIDAQSRRMMELADQIYRAAVRGANALGANNHVGEPSRADTRPD